MDDTQQAIYHAWLRQQIGVSDIQDEDFLAPAIYFEHRINWELQHPSPPMDMAHKLYVNARETIQHPSPQMDTAWQVYINTVASQVAHAMDGTQINTYRLLTGRSYRNNITREYLESQRTEENRLPAFFIYNPYSGITSDIGNDWTRGYNGIIPLGSFQSYPTQDERHAALHDEDTGERFPETEIWPVEEDEVLYHVLRMRQYDSRHLRWASYCGAVPCLKIPLKCDHALTLDRAFESEWKTFLKWQADRSK